MNGQSDDQTGNGGPHRRVFIEVIEGRLLAVKQARADDAADVRRLRHEAAVLSSTSHPNVVEFVGMRETTENVELLLAVAGRHTLSDSPPRTPAAVAEVAVDLLTIVEELHDSGVTHGSIGADHIMAGPSGRLTLISFGDATSSDRGGTQHAVDVRDDLAAIGATIAHLTFLLPNDLSRSDRRQAERLTAVASRLRDDPTAATAGRARQQLSADGPHRPRLRGGPATPRDPRPKRLARVRPARRPATTRAGSAPRVMQATDEVDDSSWAVPSALIGAAALVGLWTMGARSIGDVGGSRDALELSIGILRLVAVAASVHLIVVGVLASVAERTGSARLARMAHAAAPRTLRRVAIGVAGAGIIGALVPTSGPAHRPSEPGAEVSIDAAPEHETVPAPSTTSAVADETIGTTAPTTTAPSIQPTPSTAPPPTTTAATSDPLSDLPLVPAGNHDDESPGFEAGADDRGATGAGTATGTATVTVEAGDHLWGIAEAVLQQGLGRPPTTAEIDPYWRAVVDLNRANLADPDNPDLLFKGQVIDLPPT